MRNLINFLRRYSTWFVFGFYVVVSLALLFSSHRYQQSVYLTSANQVAATLNSVGTRVKTFVSLGSVNDSLERRNALLEAEVLNQRERIGDLEAMVRDSLGVTPQTREHRFGYIISRVLSSTTSSNRNYITVNSGTAEGVRPGMGVVTSNGVVGTVNVVGRHTARITSLLNDSQHLSVQIKGTPYSGQLVWRGRNPRIAYIEEIPRHVKCRVGDTIVTSGFSTSFPAGLPVGIVMGRVRGSDDNAFTFKVRLNTDFNTLPYVRVIKDVYKNEIDTLMKRDLR